MTYQLKATDIETLRSKLKDVDNELANFSLSESDFDNIALIGDTGAGKSTFICYGLKIRLAFQQKGVKTNPKFIINCQLQNDSLNNIPKIGNCSISETSIPKSFINMTEKINFIDTPGHMSSLGEIIEIRDSYANSKVFSKGKSIRIVIIIDYNTLSSGRGQPLIKNVKKIKNLFPVEFEKVMKASHILISKVGTESIYDEDVIKEIEEITIEQKRNNLLDEDIFNAILRVCTEKRVVCFRFPSMIEDGEIEEIIGNIRKMPSVELVADPNLEISAGGKILVEEMGRITKKEIETVEKLVYAKIDSRTLFNTGGNVSVVDKLKNEISKKNEILANMSAISSISQQTFELYDRFLDTMKMDQEDKDNFFSCMRNLKFCKSLYQNLDVELILNGITDKLKINISELNNELQEYIGTEEISRIKIEEANKSEEKIERIRKENEAVLKEYQERVEKERELERQRQIKRDEEYKKNREEDLAVRKETEAMLLGQIQSLQNQLKNMDNGGCRLI